MRSYIMVPVRGTSSVPKWPKLHTDIQLVKQCSPLGEGFLFYQHGFRAGAHCLDLLAKDDDSFLILGFVIIWTLLVSLCF